MGTWVGMSALRGVVAGRLNRVFAAVLAVSAAVAQEDVRDAAGVRPTGATAGGPKLILPGEPEVSVLYRDGSELVVQTEERWKLVCGSNPAGMSVEQLRQVVETHAALRAAGPLTVVDSGLRAGGLDIVFSVDSSVPTAALGGLALAEAYLESLFSDPITVTVAVSFQDMGGGGVIGATSSAYVRGVPYSTSRNGLVNGMDDDDVIQSWLPAGNTVPVRFDGTSAAVSNESAVDWTRAAFRATVGTVSGLAASMTYNTQFAFDYDPSNGITVGRMSFVDVAIHEVGHALGFTSATDWGTYVTALDLYRFQRTDGTGNYNPDTYEEFQVTPRLVDYNTPDDDHNSDLIVAEYRMSDGDPYQGSHFRQQTNPWIGLMDPAISLGETHYPNYFSSADINMFDAIGYDYPPCIVPQFLQQPQSQFVCGEGGTVQFGVTVDIPAPAYRWRKSSTPLADDGVHILGATTATLTIVGVTAGDLSSFYNCVVLNTADGCEATSDYAALTIKQPVALTSQPTGRTVDDGAQVVILSVSATGSAPLSYRWRRDGVPLANDGRIYGADDPQLVFIQVFASDTGSYDCIVSNPCGPVASQAAWLSVRPETTTPGDLDCDGRLTFADIDPFVLAMSGEPGYRSAYPDCQWYNADCDLDGSVDFADIDPFVGLLAGG